MSYTSEDLAALLKIAAHLESLRKWMRESCTCPPTMAETHDCKWHLTALTLDDDRTALLKAHDEIVRLQGEVRDYHAVRVGGCNHGPGLGAAFHGCEEGLEGK